MHGVGPTQPATPRMLSQWNADRGEMLASPSIRRRVLQNATARKRPSTQLLPCDTVLHSVCVARVAVMQGAGRMGAQNLELQIRILSSCLANPETLSLK